ncbi:MAG: phosphoadenosine phosphosulfate reductase family protein [Gemmatimonadaceae bacterium]
MSCSLMLPGFDAAEVPYSAASPRSRPPIATTPEVEVLLRAGAPVAFGVSGGKDSSALVLATCAYLDAIGHPRHRRIAVHADLGDIEWAASGATGRAVAAHVGIECVTVRGSRSMTETWESRWERNVVRYAALSCVTMILPWSSARMRFCTSQTKRDPITRYLKTRYPGEVIINATGIRRQESRARAQAEVFTASADLVAKRSSTSGFDWAPIADWLLDDIWAIHEVEGFPLHEAYGVYGSSRVSCTYCVLATRNDHLAALADPRNHAVTAGSVR